ncbi:MAG: DUF1934 domain-containing protein [Streptococcaceae bacterium]|jgi:uncharacterized beta-barrel protein YwiB (DUF1934 family)|nr:DUF1934 domain-containing protein [Streptococcaceae bacterium]MCH4176371.1 DUF1934 domain-containing protein [Streptococcaceae bacterium]
MVEIQFRNQVKQKETVEILEGKFLGQYTERSGARYLQYEDEGQIKTVIKLTDDCIEIIRFGAYSSKITLNFTSEGAAHFNFPEMAMDLLTRVEWIEVGENRFELAYVLLQPESEALVGSYQLLYNWR